MRMQPRRHEIDPERDALLSRLDRNATDVGRLLDHAFGQTEPVGEILEIGRGQHHDAEGHVGEIDLDRHLGGHGPLDRAANAIAEADGNGRKGARRFRERTGIGLAHGQALGRDLLQAASCGFRHTALGRPDPERRAWGGTRPVHWAELRRPQEAILPNLARAGYHRGRVRSERSVQAMPLTQPSFAKLDDVAHLIQVALTPVFLLTGIGTLINVFSTRLARVADQVDRIAQAVEEAEDTQKAAQQARLRSLRTRSVALDIAVILGAVGGAATCGAVLTLFVGALRDAARRRGPVRILRPGHRVHHRRPYGLPVRDAAGQPLPACGARQERGRRPALIRAGRGGRAISCRTCGRRHRPGRARCSRAR